MNISAPGKRRLYVYAFVCFLIATAAFVCWSIFPVMKPIHPVSSTKILDRQGGLLYEVEKQGEGLRTSVSLDKVSSSFLTVLVSSEDARFYRHHGVDVVGLTRILKDIVTRRQVISGASTIEQQLIKNLYFSQNPRTVLQKAREMIAAVYWSFTHSKKDTLELYVNTIFFGNQANGVEAAARIYFHKSAQDLTLADSALLVGIIPAPSAFDPYRYWSATHKRQELVINRLLDAGVLAPAQAEEVKTTNIDIFPPQHNIRAPHFVFRVLEELETRYPDIRAGGYTVRTSLDPELQKVAEDTIERRLLPLAPQNVGNGALVALHPRTGEILAYVGSRDYFNERIAGQVDMATAKRQPGSALKPFLYFQAFLKGFTPASVIADLPVRFETGDGKSYYPRNYGYKYYGPVLLREALGSSLNIPAVKILDRIGVGAFMGNLSGFGLRFPESPDHYGLGLVLGGGEVSLVDATEAYGRLALYAQTLKSTSVLEVRDAQGQILESAAATSRIPLFLNEPNAEKSAWLVSDILSDKLARRYSFGEANLLDLGKRVAVKTGTTKDFRDNWAFGYTPEFVLGVWVGNANNEPMEGVSGITGAVPIWHDVMKYRLRTQETINWPSVSGLNARTICIPSGQLATSICPKTRQESFIAGMEPTEKDGWYKQLNIEATSGRLATPACRTQVMQKTFFVPPPEYAAWLASAKNEHPPHEDCEGRSLSLASSPLVIISPLDGDVFESSDLSDPAGFRIPFLAGGEYRSRYRWKLNGNLLESTDSTLIWRPQPGEYELELEGANRAIRFKVQ